MKKFEVWKGNQKKMSTESLACMPTDAQLKSMKEHGYKFKIDGKVADIKKVLEVKAGITFMVQSLF